MVAPGLVWGNWLLGRLVFVLGRPEGLTAALVAAGLATEVVPAGALGFEGVLLGLEGVLLGLEGARPPPRAGAARTEAAPAATTAKRMEVVLTMMKIG